LLASFFEFAGWPTTGLASFCKIGAPIGADPPDRPTPGATLASFFEFADWPITTVASFFKRSHGSRQLEPAQFVTSRYLAAFPAG
jgi:hypothetical protein